MSSQQLPPGFDPMFAMRLMSAIKTLEQDAETAPHIERLRRAHQTFFSGRCGSGDNMQAERVYMELYEDLRSHQDLWFRAIYASSVPMSHVFCEWTVGMLGTLATVRRQRGDLAKCLEVLRLDEKVLRQYQTLTTTNEELCNDPRVGRCVSELTYKYNLIASNANQEARNREACLKAFRAAVRHEIEQQFSWDRQKLAFVIKPRADMMGQDYMSVDFLEQTPDDHIWSILMSNLQSSGSFPPPKKTVPWICDGCGDEEELCGDYKRCSKCHIAYYCSRDCQVKHWKLHKRDCKKKKISSSLMQDIKKTCKSTIRNYSEAVKALTGADVSEINKKAAFPDLVELAKNHILEHPRLDPGAAFTNANSDLQFRKKIDHFMEAQPGFVLNNPQKNNITDEQRAALITNEEMELCEIGLREVAKQTLVGLAPIFARKNLTPNGEEQDLACQYVVSAVKAYTADRPEYQAPENFSKAVREGKFNEVMAEAFCDYFNGVDRGVIMMGRLLCSNRMR